MTISPNFSKTAILFMRAAIRNKKKIVPTSINGFKFSTRVCGSLLNNDYLRGDPWPGRQYVTAEGERAIQCFLDKSITTELKGLGLL